MDVLVIGGGPAGVAAAVRARELGAAVTLLEAQRIGGTSINDGPAPVRTLARAARLVRDAGAWDIFGLRGSAPTIDLRAVLENATRVAAYAHEEKHLAATLRQNGITLYEGVGPATFRDAHTVALADQRRFAADSIIIAAGGHGRKPPIPGNELGLTYADLWSLTALPASVAVVGGAATGCQLASIFADFGCAVTLIEAGPELHRDADVALKHGLTAAFQKRGMRVITDAWAERLAEGAAGITLRYRQGDVPAQLTVAAVFFAVGWSGNLTPLTPEAAGIATARSYITTNDYLQTSQPSIYAVGDINGQSMLVQSAKYEGRIAAENAVLEPHRRFIHTVVPWGSFTDPEYASVGLSEAEALEHHDIGIATIHYADLLRPVADARPDGFCKLIVDRHQRYILGAHVLGEYAVEVIQVAAACMVAGMRVEQLAEIQFAYPTFTEALGIAAQQLARELGIVPTAPNWDTFAQVHL